MGVNSRLGAYSIKYGISECKAGWSNSKGIPEIPVPSKSRSKSEIQGMFVRLYSDQSADHSVVTGSYLKERRNI